LLPARLSTKYNDVDDATGNTSDGLFNDPDSGADRVDLLNTLYRPMRRARCGSRSVRNYFTALKASIPSSTGNYVFFIAFADRCCFT
jgi:hypothetical protein